MCKIILSVAMFLNVIPMENKVIQVEKIEYLTSNYYNNSVHLDIKFKSSGKDIIQFTIFFYNKDKSLLNNKYYSSSLLIEGNKSTKAIIPVEFTEKIYLNIVLYSGTLEKEILDVMFPLYPKEANTCNLSEYQTCTSMFPNLIVYQNGEIQETYEHISLVNEKLGFNAFDNLVPVNKIRIINNLELLDGYSFLILEKELNQFKINYNDKYIFPLSVVRKKDILNFEFMDLYYIDPFNGETSENYLKNGVLKNNIMLPYEEEKYVFQIEMRDMFSSFNVVEMEFYVETFGKLIGKCSESKYCFRRNYQWK